MTASSAKLATRLTAAGNALEWFDYFAFSSFAPEIAQNFFTRQGHNSALLETYAVFAISFIIRPTGGYLWGIVGDRYGRKIAMSMTIILLTAATAGIGLLPTASAWGLASPILLFILRLIQGLATSGEYIGSALLLTEDAPEKEKGSLNALIPSTTTAGVVLSIICSSVIRYFFNTEQVYSWGWRIPFLIAAPCGLIIWYSRKFILETSTFETASHSLDNKKQSLFFPITKPVAGVFWVTALDCLGFYTILVYLPTFMQNNSEISSSAASSVSTIASIVYMVIVLYAGRISKIITMKKQLIFSSIALAIVSIPAFIILLHKNYILLFCAYLLLGLLLSLNDSIISTVITQQFSPTHRYSGGSFLFNLCNAIFGGTAPLIITWAISETHNNLFPGIYMTVIAISSALGCLWLKNNSLNESPLFPNKSTVILDR